MSEQAQFTIEDLRLDDVEEMTALRYELFDDTYVNEALGVTREWLQERNASKRSPEHMQAWRDVYAEGKANGTARAWAARNSDGKMIGFATPFIEPGGTQRVGAIYVEKSWHGMGVANALMQKVIDWCDPAKPIELNVVVYNERAKAFYHKWGFEEVRGSETLFADKIPEIKMVRQPSARHSELANSSTKDKKNYTPSEAKLYAESSSKKSDSQQAESPRAPNGDLSPHDTKHEQNRQEGGV